MHRRSTAPRVAIYRSQLLSRSETFIRSQAMALRRWKPILIGSRAVEHGLSLAPLSSHIVTGKGAFQRAHLFGCQTLGLSHNPTTQRLKEADPALIHVHFGTDATDIWPSISSLGKPLLVTLHGFDINTHREYWESGRGGIRRRQYPSRLLNLANQTGVNFIAVSEAIRNRAIEFGIPSDRVILHYIGVDTDEFKPTGSPIGADRQKVLFVGRLVEKKGTAYLIRAFAEVVKRVPKATLTVIGDGPLRKSLESLANHLQVPVEFAGVRTSGEVRQHMLESRVFCLPSIRAQSGDAEGLPIAILEAQSCGLPVITSANGGRREGIEDGVTGYAHEEGDILLLAARIVEVLSNDALAASMGQAARQRVVTHFSMTTAAVKLEHIYDSCAGLSK